jgi:hypothetical protein
MGLQESDVPRYQAPNTTSACSANEPSHAGHIDGVDGIRMKMLLLNPDSMREKGREDSNRPRRVQEEMDARPSPRRFANTLTLPG